MSEKCLFVWKLGLLFPSSCNVSNISFEDFDWFLGVVLPGSKIIGFVFTTSPSSMAVDFFVGDMTHIHTLSLQSDRVWFGESNFRFSPGTGAAEASDSGSDDDESSEEEERKAPNELIMEFLQCVMDNDMENGLKLCKMSESVYVEYIFHAFCCVCVNQMFYVSFF